MYQSVRNMNAEGERKQEYVAIEIDFHESLCVEVCVTLACIEINIHRLQLYCCKGRW
jgi:hypothetical protein